MNPPLLSNRPAGEYDSAMAGTIEFWFDYSCPYAYLASTQVERLAREEGAGLIWKPMLLGGVFRAVGTAQNLSQVLHPSKARHNINDMQRWAALFRAPLKMPDGHPFRTVEALRATLAAGVDPQTIHGFYRAYWVDNQPPSAPETIRRVLEESGHDSAAIMTRLDDPAIKDDLRRRTDEAIALGIFGAPAFWVNGRHLFWGQDRMDFVRRALRGWNPDERPLPDARLWRLA
ncbi:MAG: 2-hydroxychromene-2-carboxylate isomerase [Myxococcota bacterium]|nr:2-hydroxychromene-2-carboxylate isomerase [Myxococcota bacterium]